MVRAVAAAAAVTAEPGPATATAEQVSILSKPVGTIELPPRPDYYLGSLRGGARPPAVLCADEVSDGSEGGDSAEEHSSDGDESTTRPAAARRTRGAALRARQTGAPSPRRPRGTVSSQPRGARGRAVRMEQRRRKTRSCVAASSRATHRRTVMWKWT